MPTTKNFLKILNSAAKRQNTFKKAFQRAISDAGEGQLARHFFDTLSSRQKLVPSFLLHAGSPT
ncbi:MAG: hypothetical protein CBE00_04745 [Planctomycetaceae bacterium TMED240]|nr:hypothetical protein [Rhodopirellula sp.]OUX07532.1 MAG: hypothetical protein CBE00_04745 [Planctomycetaceae bacterium TMED240]